VIAHPSKTSPLAAALALALALGCATSKDQQAGALPSYQETKTETATAEVKAIDQKTRKVTLLENDGTTFTFVAGPEVRNLAQVQVGDTVKATYTASIAIEVKRADGTAPELQAAADVTRAPIGEMPSGTIAGVVTASATIVAIDRTTNRVTLKGPEGNFRVVQARDPKNLENVQVGDMVYATYTESLGLSVERIPPADAK
jgi:Cu/Ag efflux protein CusF